MNANFVLNYLKKAIKDNNVSNTNLIIHSDQGIHFSCRSYINLLKKENIIGSHSRRGNCLDNSPIESFFHYLRKKLFGLINLLIFMKQTKVF